MVSCYLKQINAQAVWLAAVCWLLLVSPAAANPGPLPAESLPDSALIDAVSHTYQRWNNCGPATTSMALSTFGIQVPQTRIQAILKPDIEDVNVSPHQIAGYLTGQGLQAPVRINGRIERLMQLTAAGIPVIVETWITEKGGMGHYRLIRGYDRQAGVLIAHDSYFGPDVHLPFEEFDQGWAAFNRLYIPIHRPEQAGLVAEILGVDVDSAAMWATALAEAEQHVAIAPEDALAWHVLGDDRLATGDLASAAAAYGRAVELGLPWRFFWYQFGPFEAYLAVGRYRTVLTLSASTLARMPNIEELHLYRGKAFLGLSRRADAATEFRLALKYNPHFSPAARELARLLPVRVARHGAHTPPQNP